MFMTPVYIILSDYSLALLLLICSTSLSCTPHHALSAPLLTLASSVFRTDVKDSKDSAPFLSLVLPSGTVSLCLPFSVRHAQTLSAFKSQLKTHVFSVSYSCWFKLSWTCLSNLGNMCVCVCASMRACACVYVRTHMCVCEDGERVMLVKYLCEFLVSRTLHLFV